MRAQHEEEQRRLAKDRKLFETHVLALKQHPDKQERAEITQLKAELDTLRATMAANDQKSASTIARLKEKIETLTARNKELEDEVKQLERARIEQWGRASVRDTADSSQEARVQSAATQSSQLAPQSSSALVSEYERELDELVASTKTSESYSPLSLSASIRPALDVNPVVVRHTATEPANTSTEPFAAPSSSSSAAPEPQSLQVGSTKVLLFPNGTRKEIDADGTMTVTFFNGDIKRTFSDGRVLYFYAETNSTQVSYPDGLEVLEFANGQVERRFPDGTVEIRFVDDTVKTIFPNHEEETVFADGTIQRVTASGERVIEFPSGQREIHTASYKQRRYPDGTVKIVYTDGRQETEFANGRVRVKDKDGRVLADGMAR
jgi:centromere protein J